MICTVEITDLLCATPHGTYLVSLTSSMCDLYNESTEDYLDYDLLSKLVMGYVLEQKQHALEQLAANLAIIIMSVKPDDMDSCTVTVKQPPANKNAPTIAVSQTLTSDEYENVTRPDLWLWKREFTEKRLSYN
ncbi:hypothetical protein GNI_155460 [Gregarina niphandrodes]|uniref:Uncharacterized protein n=1 Tax=Gregarina niphandrodes TaxID=110365 RepID=A0A023AZM1_GRENI|nr:hypothetical protein GNI_155460 [Gregarina niphandrodes]EZG43953.1 hypothetical protein GNI_155460 [Gregarina niphandrodes]|eukprot:XP_011132884.1 hypothetical protein GNI_155460 [Gregarina niphandrodes]